MKFASEEMDQKKCIYLWNLPPPPTECCMFSLVYVNSGEHVNARKPERGALREAADSRTQIRWK